MTDIHPTCEAIWDHDITGVSGPICEDCLDRLGRMDFLSSRRG